MPRSSCPHPALPHARRSQVKSAVLALGGDSAREDKEPWFGMQWVGLQVRELPTRPYLQSACTLPDWGPVDPPWPGLACAISCS